jgi:SAM-dependent methyltransferase
MLAALKHRVKNYLVARISRTNPLSADTEATLRYLLDEVSDLRALVRAITVESAVRKADVVDTCESFSYQWAELPEGKHLASDSQFQQVMFELVSKYTGLAADWFVGKTVLDAGCGNGRWSYAFAKLGAKVTAVDQSASGIAHLKALLGEKYDFEAWQANLLEPLPFKPEFDLVWCYGAVHHTGNTRRAIENVSATVKPGGRIFLMVYGEPRSGIECNEINNYVKLRRDTQFMTFEQKRDYLAARFFEPLVHGYFDAISPRINDLHRFDEIEDWLRAVGFRAIRRTLESRNHHIVADRSMRAG